MGLVGAEDICDYAAILRVLGRSLGLCNTSFILFMIVGRKSEPSRRKSADIEFEQYKAGMWIVIFI